MSDPVMTSTDPTPLRAAEFLQALYGADPEGYLRLEYVGPSMRELFLPASDAAGVINATLGRQWALHVEFDGLRYVDPDRWASEMMASRFLWVTVPDTTALDLAFCPLLPSYVVALCPRDASMRRGYVSAELYWCLTEECEPDLALSLSRKLTDQLGAPPPGPGCGHPLHVPGTDRRLGWADYSYELIAATGAQHEVDAIRRALDQNPADRSSNQPHGTAAC
jgi:hypothetical protein